MPTHDCAQQSSAGTSRPQKEVAKRSNRTPIRSLAASFLFAQKRALSRSLLLFLCAAVRQLRMFTEPREALIFCRFISYRPTIPSDCTFGRSERIPRPSIDVQGTFGIDWTTRANC